MNSFTCGFFFLGEKATSMGNKHQGTETRTQWQEVTHTAKFSQKSPGRREDARGTTYGKRHVVPASHKRRHSDQTHLLFLLLPPPHGTQIIVCSHRARMAAAMWEQISANKGWKLRIQETHRFPPTVKKTNQKKSKLSNVIESVSW